MESKINFKELTDDELKSFIEESKKELVFRQKDIKQVIYTHDCVNGAKHHYGKYKHWAKIVDTIDTTQKGGYMFGGRFLDVKSENSVPNGSIIVEVCGSCYSDYYKCYRVTQNGKELLTNAKSNEAITFAQIVKKFISEEKI